MTPEPWKLDEETGDITTPDGYLIASVALHGNVNIISRTGETYSHADGKLIEKCPVMLRLLRDVKLLLDDGTYNKEKRKLFDDIEKCIRDIENERTTREL